MKKARVVKSFAQSAFKDANFAHLTQSLGMLSREIGFQAQHAFLLDNEEWTNTKTLQTQFGTYCYVAEANPAEVEKKTQTMPEDAVLFTDYLSSAIGVFPHPKDFVYLDYCTTLQGNAKSRQKGITPQQDIQRLFEQEALADTLLLALTVSHRPFPVAECMDLIETTISQASDGLYEQHPLNDLVSRCEIYGPPGKNQGRMIFYVTLLQKVGVSSPKVSHVNQAAYRPKYDLATARRILIGMGENAQYWGLPMCKRRLKKLGYTTWRQLHYKRKRKRIQ